MESNWSRFDSIQTTSIIRQFLRQLYVNFASISRQFFHKNGSKIFTSISRQFHVNYTSILRQFRVNFTSIWRQLFYFKLMSKWSQNGVDFDLINKGKVSQAKTDQLLPLEALKFHMFLWDGMVMSYLNSLTWARNFIWAEGIKPKFFINILIDV